MRTNMLFISCVIRYVSRLSFWVSSFHLETKTRLKFSKCASDSARTPLLPLSFSPRGSCGQVERSLRLAQANWTEPKPTTMMEHFASQVEPAGCNNLSSFFTIDIHSHAHFSLCLTLCLCLPLSLSTWAFNAWIIEKSLEWNITSSCSAYYSVSTSACFSVCFSIPFSVCSSHSPSHSSPFSSARYALLSLRLYKLSSSVYFTCFD